MNSEKADLYFVVINHEEQYSIWPHWKDVPLGWSTIGSPMEKSACLEYIEKVWTDMRPLSLRQYLAEHANDSTDSKNKE